MLELLATITAWIFVLSPNCINDNSQLALHDQMNATITQFDPYIPKDIQYVCMGGVNLADIEDLTVPLLREVYPTSPLVFVWPDLQEYRSYLSTIEDGTNEDKTNGHSTTSLGSSVVGENPNTARTIKHELTHTSNCLEHQHSSDPVTSWYKIQDPPFCP